MASRTPITVDPTVSLQANDYTDGQSFFPDELVRARRLIERQFDALPTVTADELRSGRDRRGKPQPLQHRHEAICVLGPRGAGKTSFMLSLVGGFATHEHVQVLPMLDPTVLDDDREFLPTIVSNILQVLPEDIDDPAFGDALGEVAHGLHAIAGGQPSDRVDPMTYARSLLDGAHGSLSLVDAFHRLIAAGARLLGKKGFVQPIDDVDIAFERGWAVLETVRRYLKSGRVATVISGDMDLYRMLVRGEQWKKLAPLIEIEAKAYPDDQATERMQTYCGQVGQLESQYLTKILPPGRRVRLESVVPRIAAAARGGQELIELRAGPGAAPVPLSNVFAVFSRDLLGWRWPSSEVGLRVVDSRRWWPARMIPWNTRLLVRFFDILASDGQPSARLAQLRELFDDGLSQHRLTVDELESLTRGEGYARVVRYFVEALLDERQQPWQLIGSAAFEGSARRINQVEWLLQAHVYQGWRARKPSLRPIQFGLLAIRPVQVLAAAIAQAPDEAIALSDGLLRHLAIEESTLEQVSGRLLGWQLSSSTINRVPGAVRLVRAPGSIDKRYPALAAYKPDVGLYETGITLIDVWWSAFFHANEEESDDERLADYNLAPSRDEFMRAAGFEARLMLRLFETRIVTARGALLFIDFFLGLARICRMAGAASREPWRWNQVVDWASEERTYPARAQGAASAPAEPGAPEIRGTDFGVEDPALIEKELGHVRRAVDRWVKSWSGEPPPPTLIARALDRVADSLDYRTHGKGLPSQSVGQLLRVWTVAFLNALLVEEMAQTPEVKLQKATVRRSMRVFAENLTRCEEYFRARKDDKDATARPDLPRFTIWWSLCPPLRTLLPRELRQTVRDLRKFAVEDRGPDAFTTARARAKRSRRLGTTTWNPTLDSDAEPLEVETFAVLCSLQAASDSGPNRATLAQVSRRYELGWPIDQGPPSGQRLTLDLLSPGRSQDVLALLLKDPDMPTHEVARRLGVQSATASSYIWKTAADLGLGSQVELRDALKAQKAMLAQPGD